VGINPYYYTITSNLWCTTVDGTDCKVAAGPTSGYTVNIPFVWCNASNLSSIGLVCQARRSDSPYRYVNLVGASSPGVTAVQATGTLTFTQAGDNTTATSTKITAVTVGGTNVLASPVVVTGVNGATKLSQLAAAVAANISGGAPCNYTATSSGAVVTFVANATTPTSCNGQSISITSSDTGPTYRLLFDTNLTSPTGSSPVTLPTGTTTTLGGSQTQLGSRSTYTQHTFSITQAGDNTDSIGSTFSVTSIKVGTIEVLGSTVSVSGLDGASKWNALASAIVSGVNSYHPPTDWSASVSGNQITLIAPTKSTAYNGLAVVITFSQSAVSVTHTVTTSTVKTAGGVNYVAPVNIPGATFTRVDIVSGGTFPNTGGARTDCATNYNATTPALSGPCTYSEEMTNYANWFAYYRTRTQTMKSATSLAFANLSTNFRVGFVDLFGTQFLPVQDFSGTNRDTWFAKLFAQSTGNSTPLRTALSRVGRYFAGKTDGINSILASTYKGSYPAPVQYSCQQNFAVMTTDGYWNGTDGYDLDGNDMSNTSYDSVDAPPTARNNGHYQGIYDGGLSKNSLSDVAAYYYNTDLIPDSQSNGQPKVPVSDADPNNQQHLTLFTLGLGVDGRLRYTSDYQTNKTGDFWKIVNGDTNCSWKPGATCNWPAPSADADTAVDDLWHAAVNGHGSYFSAKQPQDVVNGLTSALATISAVTGSAAAAATSNPVVTQTDNQLFISQYRTQKWDGELLAYTIDPNASDATAISTSPVWSARAQIDAMVPASRKLYTRNSSGALVAFNFASLDSTAQSWFVNRGALLSQYASLGSTEHAILDNGTNIVNYLRGDKTFESSSIMRPRDHILGDTVDGAPVYVRNPRRQYADAGYLGTGGFAARNAARIGIVYVASNDGFLHALNGTDGSEVWAYAPRMVLQNMVHLASRDYGNNHRFFLDGTPAYEDVYDTTAAKWRTILVGGLDAGGRGYYALDVTDPANPVSLWEFCNDSSICTHSDASMGYSYGNPLIGKRASDGRWVVIVSSGYLNGSTAPGKIFILDAITGAVLQTVSTGGDGLAKINGWVDQYDFNNTITDVYGGDLGGTVWKIGLSTVTPSVTAIAKVADSSSTSQPIMVKPLLTKCQNLRFVLLGTGQYLDTSDISNLQRNTVYGFVDDIDPTVSSRINLHSSSRMYPQPYPTSSTTYATSSTATLPQLDLSNFDGWYMDLTSGTGERVNVDQLLANQVLVTYTNTPAQASGDVCSSATGGTSNQYQQAYCSGVLRQAPLANPYLTVGATKVYFTTSAKAISVGSDGSVHVNTINTPSPSGTLRAPRSSWREILPSSPTPAGL
jgi:type IV pilus assembly protein PilY1